MGSPAFAHVYTHTYSRTHSIVFLSDNLRNTLREIIRENGLSPDKLMQDWETIERGIRTWLQSGHLNKVVVEFYRPAALVASARWEFPIGYSGSGVDDDMWLDKSYLRQLIAKSARPTSDLHLSRCSLHRSWGAVSLRLCRLCIPLHGTARSTPGWNGHRHRPLDGRRDVLEVAL